MRSPDRLDPPKLALSLGQPSPELEAYFDLCMSIYERKVADGTWEAALAEIRDERHERERSA